MSTTTTQAALTVACCILGFSTSSTSSASTGMPIPHSALEWAADHTTVPGVTSDVAGGAYPLDRGDRFGRASASIGDVDGDGIPDVAVCASRDGDGGFQYGAVYIMLLNSDSSVRETQKISQLFGGFSELGGQLDEEDLFGYTLAGLGDVDDDGVPDVLAGANGDDDGSEKSGAAYVLFLNRNGTLKAFQKISNTEGGIVDQLGASLEAGGAFGESAAALGDFDGDGVPDAMVGAPQAGASGALYLMLLNRNGTVKHASTISATTGGFAAASGSGAILRGDLFSGRGIALLGDLDADGVVEIAVGSRGADTEGALWILSVDADFAVVRKQKISSNGDGGFPFPIAANSANDQARTSDAEFGNSLSAIGDVDHDGVPDLAVSANNLGAGTLFILTLNANGTVKEGSVYAKNAVGGVDSPFAAMATLPDDDRLCRSVSAISNFHNDGGFVLLCGGGAKTTGDVWLLRFGVGAGDGTNPSAGYDVADDVADVVADNCTSGTHTVFEVIDGYNYCQGGTTLFSNWKHSTQTVTGPLSLAECKASCSDTGCQSMAVKEADGRCILKTGCTVATSTEESIAYVVSTTDQIACAEPEPEPEGGWGGGGGGGGGRGDFATQAPVESEGCVRGVDYGKDIGPMPAGCSDTDGGSDSGASTDAPVASEGCVRGVDYGKDIGPMPAGCSGGDGDSSGDGSITASGESADDLATQEVPAVDRCANLPRGCKTAANFDLVGELRAVLVAAGVSTETVQSVMEALSELSESDIVAAIFAGDTPDMAQALADEAIAAIFDTFDVDTEAVSAAASQIDFDGNDAKEGSAAQTTVITKFCSVAALVAATLGAVAV